MRIPAPPPLPSHKVKRVRLPSARRRALVGFSLRQEHWARTRCQPTSSYLWCSHYAEQLKYTRRGLSAPRQARGLAPAARLLHVVAFHCSGRCRATARGSAPCASPFNPMLGHTFKCERKNLGFFFFFFGPYRQEGSRNRPRMPGLLR